MTDEKIEETCLFCGEIRMVSILAPVGALLCQECKENFEWRIKDKKVQVEGEVSEEYPYIHLWECFKCGAIGIIKGARGISEPILILCQECDPKDEWDGEHPNPSRYN